MKKYNYFDDDEVCEEISENLSENVSEENDAYNYSSILSKLNQENERILEEKLEQLEAPSRPDGAEDEEVKSIVSGSMSRDEVLDAIKEFSHKSGDKFIAAARAIVQGNVFEELERANRKKHLIIAAMMCLCSVLIFTCMIGCFIHAMNKETERIRDFNVQAGKVCADYIKKYGNPNYENLYDTYGVKGYRLTGICFARELDFDNNGSSELMITYNKNGVYYNEIWGYNKDDVFTVLFSEKTAQADSKAKDAWSTLYYKNNKYYIAVPDEKDADAFQLYQLKRDKFSKKFAASYNVKEESYKVDGKDDTPAFERIKYAVFSYEKATYETDKVSKIIEGFSGTAEVIARPDGSMSMKNAYYSVVQEHNARYGKAKYVEKNGLGYIDGLAAVRLIDFDNDGQQELLLVFRKTIKQRKENMRGEYITVAIEKYYCDIYRYNGSKAVLAYSNEGISGMLNDTNDAYFIIRHKDKKASYCVNTFKTSNYGRYVSANSTAYRFNGTEFKSYYKSAYVREYGYTYYRLDGERASADRFREKGYKIPYFNGEEKYNTNEYEVTFVQRKAGKAAGLAAEVEKTEKVIQQLNQLYSSDGK